MTEETTLRHAIVAEARRMNALGINVFGGMDVRCLQANHGMIVAGPTLGRAMWLAVELETRAKQYHLSSLGGSPMLPGETEIAETARGFAC